MYASLPIRYATVASDVAAFRRIVHKRKSCYRFQPNRSIDPAILEDILESTIRSPSSYNIQPTQVIVVQDSTLKERIAETAMIGKGNQYRTKDCSALVVFCSDLQPSLRIRRILELERNHKSLPRHPDYLAMMPISTSFMLGEGHAATFLKQATMDFLSTTANQPMPEIDSARVWSYKNTSLMVQSFVLAATSYNLHTSIMEGFDPRRIKDILHIPDDRYGIPMAVATGYEYINADEDKNATNVDESICTNESVQTARLGMEEVVFRDTFGVPINF